MTSSSGSRFVANGPAANEAVAPGGFAACHLGVTGVGDQPYLATEAEAAIVAGATFADAAQLVTAGQRVATDIHADREYRAAMAVVMARRALEAARARLG